MRKPGNLRSKRLSAEENWNRERAHIQALMNRGDIPQSEGWTRLYRIQRKKYPWSRPEVNL